MQLIDRVIEEMNFEIPDDPIFNRVSSGYYEKLLPLYTRLRELGYSARDLGC